jgi:hypothetical protein
MSSFTASGAGAHGHGALKPDPSYFWPKEWLPRHPAFRNVRIHSFGYDSDWKAKGQSTVTTHDFGQALLLALRTSECFSAVSRSLLLGTGQGAFSSDFTTVSEPHCLCRA